jgi:hypothetical protein
MRTIHVRMAAAFMAVALLCALPAAAQTQTGDITGRVLDSSGAALPGVTVTIENAAQSVPQSAITTETGAFRFANLAIGTYRATFELTGFKKLVLEQVIVALGASTDLQPKLDISKVQETVTVTGASPVVETSAVRTGQTFSREQLEGLPTARDPWVILEMTPGLVMTQQNVGGNKSGQQSGFVSHGGAQGNAMWNVDGVTITDMAATGSSPTYFDFDAFQEMQITTGGNDASMQTGGVNLNMVTKSGGNTVRGSARLFVTDQQFQANNSTPALRAQGAGSGNPIQNIRDYGAEVGGPLLRNRAWFWGGSGKQDIRVGVIGFNKPTPECNPLPANFTVEQQRACLNTDLTVLQNYNAKLNLNATRDQRFSFHYAYGDKIRNARGVSPTTSIEAAAAQSGPGHTYKGGWQWIVSDRLVVDTGASYIDTGFILDFTRPELAAVQGAVDLGTGLTFRSGLVNDNIRPQSQVNLDANWFVPGRFGADHTLKFGVKYRDTPFEIYQHRGGFASTTFRNGAAVEATMFRDTALRQDLTQAGVYLNDSMRKGRVTLNAGLRADYWNDGLRSASVAANPIVPDLLPAVSFAGADAGRTWLNWSPRFSATYDLRGSGKTILKASGSIFYGQGIFVSGQLNPVTEVAITFPWTDTNGDRFAQAPELSLAGRRLVAGNYDFANPASPTTRNLVDPGIENDRTSEFLAGIDHELMPNFGMSAMYIWRRFDGFQIAERQGLNNGDWFETTATLPCGNANCGQASYPVKFFELPFTIPAPSLLVNQAFHRSFNGFEVAATKRMANRWMLNGSIALNAATSHWEAGEHAFVDPTNVALSDGRDALAQNARWVAKLSGLYELPWRDIRVSGTLNAREGFPFNPTVQSAVRAGVGTRANVLIEPVATRRLDNFAQVDLAASKTFTIDRVRATADVAVFNALNRNTVLARAANFSAATANNVTEILAPRVIRFGIRLRF